MTSKSIKQSNENSLVIQNLSKSFFNKGKGKLILSGIDLTVEGGELLVILGPSGCGKSTLMRIIAGLEPYDQGRSTKLLLNGQPITGPGPDRGVVFQSFSSFPWLTVRQNVEWGLKFSQSNKTEKKVLGDRYMSLVNLTEYADFYPRDLSGGQQQRLAIARTLATSPQILLMDEPYASLDIQNRELQQTELLRIWKESRPTIIFITHDISEAIFLGQRIVVLSNSPSTIIQEVNTEIELEQKIHTNRLHLRSTNDPRITNPEQETCKSAVRLLSKSERGSWIRTQPEYYQLVDKLKNLLPIQS